MRLRRGAGRDTGAATLELTGVTIVAAVIVVALLTAALPQARALGETYSYWVCKVVTLGQGSCSPPAPESAHVPTEPCVLTSDGVERNQKISVIVVTAEDGRRIEVSELSNGDYRVTVSDTDGAGVEAGVGGGLSLTVNDRTVGANVNASASASLVLTNGQEYRASPQDMPDLMDALMQDQLSDTIVGDNGLLRWVTDKGLDLTGLGKDLPSPEATYAEGGVSLNASAEATAFAESASAGVSDAQVLGVRTARDGSRTVYLKTTVTGEAGLQSLGINTDGVDFEGAGVSGEVEVINAVRFDEKGNMVNVQASAAVGGESTGVASALFGGSSDNDLTNSENGLRIYQATLPIKTSTDQKAANDYLVSVGVQTIGAWTAAPIALAGIPGQVGFFQATRDRGVVTQQDYDTDSSTTFAYDASGKLVVELGASGSVRTDSMSTTGAQYWDGAQWTDWEACS